MGNTGVALGRDGAAPFMNPATIVGIDDRQVAFSVNLLTLQLNRFADFHAPGAADPAFGDLRLQSGSTSVTSTRLTALPSTLCLFIAFSALVHGEAAVKEDPTPWKGGHQRFAICLGTLESDDLLVPALALHSPTAAGATAQNVSFSRKWGRAQVGPSYSAQINDRLALGASLHVAYTTTSFIQDAVSVSSLTDGSAVQSSLGASANGHSFDLTATVGGTYTLGLFTFGASIQVPSLHLGGAYSTTLHQTFAGLSGDNATVASGSGSFSAGPPVRIAAGIGTMLPRLTLEVDAALDFPKPHALATEMHVTNTAVVDDMLTTAQYPAEFAVRTHATVNAQVGAEYFMSERLSFLTGFWTNLTALSALNPLAPPSLGNLVQTRTQRVGLSLGLGSYGDNGELLVGTQLGYGWGQAIAANLYAVPNSWSVVDTSSFSALFIIAGSTNFSAIRHAVEGVKEAVTPRTTPAAEPPHRPDPQPPRAPEPEEPPAPDSQPSDSPAPPTPDSPAPDTAPPAKSDPQPPAH
jgi:hypothetical protein